MKDFESNQFVVITKSDFTKCTILHNTIAKVGLLTGFTSLVSFNFILQGI